jgi:hypothetical protein
MKDMLEHMRLLRDERNSMLWWWPRVAPLGALGVREKVQMPETTLVRCEEPLPLAWACEWEDGGHPPDPPWLAEVERAVRGHGYARPCFLRGDGASAKHDWQRTCYVEAPEDTAWHVMAICQWHLMIDLGPDLRGFAVRDYVPLPEGPVMVAQAYENMPLRPEWRYFVRDGEVECRHPYWPVAAGERGRPDVEDWQAMLAEQSKETPEQVALLTRWSARLCEALGGGYWSLDYMAGPFDSLWFTDCALGEVSWHDAQCEYAPKEADD